MADVLIKNGILLDLERFERGDVLIMNGKLIAVGGIIHAEVDRTIDATGMIVMPGLINAHTHSNQALERGLSDNLPLDTWMVLASYGGAGAQLDARELKIAAQVGAIEMLLTGTTSVVDMARVGVATFQEDAAAIMQAYQEVGLRALVAASYTDRDFFESVPVHLVTDDPPRSDRRYSTPDEFEPLLREFVGHWRGRHPRLTPGLGPSSLPRCTEALFERSVALAHELEAPMQSHLMSAKSQVLVERERYGGSTVQYLERIDALGPRFSYAHCIWIDQPDIERMARGGVVAVTNPTSNLKLGSGIAPMQAYHRAGTTVALGTDGASSSDSQNMWEIVKDAAIVHKSYGHPRDWIGTREALGACWEGGARAMQQPLGALKSNYRADLMLLRTDRLFVLPHEFMLNQLVYSEVGSAVDTVLVDGEVVVEGGKVVTVDAKAVYDQAREIVKRIYADMDERRARFARTEGLLEAMETHVRNTVLPFSRTCALT